jgi:putative transferase (TIGR04331 family)
MLWVQSNSAYLETVVGLVNRLPKKIRERTLVRPKNARALSKPARVSGQQISEILGNDVQIDFGSKGLNEIQSQNRLSIVTYNESSIPSNLMVNHPTVAVWDPKFVQLRPSAQVTFDRLFEVKILHYSAESAAQHVQQIWDDIDSWWQSPEVIEARDLFCERFARRKNFPALAVAKALADYR